MFPPPDPGEVQRTVERIRARAEFRERHELRPAPDTIPSLPLHINTDRVQSLRVDNIDSLSEVAQLLRELADLVRTHPLNSVRRAHDQLRPGDHGPSRSFFGDDDVGGVVDLVRCARNTSSQVTRTLEGVAKALGDVAPIVEQVGRSFRDVKRMTDEQLESMNRQFATRLRGPEQPTS